MLLSHSPNLPNRTTVHQRLKWGFVAHFIHTNRRYRDKQTPNIKKHDFLPALIPFIYYSLRSKCDSNTSNCLALGVTKI